MPRRVRAEPPSGVELDDCLSGAGERACLRPSWSCSVRQGRLYPTASPQAVIVHLPSSPAPAASSSQGEAPSPTAPSLRRLPQRRVARAFADPVENTDRSEITGSGGGDRRQRVTDITLCTAAHHTMRTAGVLYDTGLRRLVEAQPSSTSSDQTTGCQLERPVEQSNRQACCHLCYTGPKPGCARGVGQRGKGHCIGVYNLASRNALRRGCYEGWQAAVPLIQLQTHTDTC